MTSTTPVIRTLLLALTLFVAAPAAYAHAYLVSSTPAALDTVRSPLERIALEFSEPIEVRFSTFVLVPLGAAPDLGVRELAALAREVANEALGSRTADRAPALTVRADGRTSTTIVLEPDAPLERGPYVVAWRVLSIDTHTTSDFLVFRYEPEE